MSVITFLIVLFNTVEGTAAEHIPTSLPPVPQMPARKRCTSGVEVSLEHGEYELVPVVSQVGVSSVLCWHCTFNPHPFDVCRVLVKDRAV